MKWTIEYVRNGDFFKVVNEGIYEPGESVELYQSIFSNERWTPGASILFDNRLIDYRNVNYEVMSQSSSNLANNEAQIGNSKIGYLVDSSLGYGISRQFQLLAEGKISTKIEVFKEEEKAVGWITRKQDDE